MSRSRPRSRNLLVRNRGLVIAGVLVVLAGVIFYFGDLAVPPKAATPPAPQGPTLAGVTAAQVQAFEIRARGKVLTVTRLKSGKGWSYALCASADPGCAAVTAGASEAGALLDAIVNLRASATAVGGPAGLPSYGLDKPQAGITLRTTTGRTIDLQVGSKTPDTSLEYVRRADGKDVYAVPVTALDGGVLGAIDSPPAPPPPPSPRPTVAPAPSPSA